MSSELLDALEVLEKQKGISRDVLIEAIEAALVTGLGRKLNINVSRREYLQKTREERNVAWSQIKDSLVKSGSSIAFPAPRVLALGPVRGIGMEVMDTAAACRTRLTDPAVPISTP